MKQVPIQCDQPDAAVQAAREYLQCWIENKNGREEHLFIFAAYNSHRPDPKRSDEMFGVDVMIIYNARFSNFFGICNATFPAVDSEALQDGCFTLLEGCFDHVRNQAMAWIERIESEMYKPNPFIANARNFADWMMGRRRRRTRSNKN